MKFRSDFVTNSSSSSFIVSISIETKDGNLICFDGNGGTPESGRIDFFEYDAIITASPKKMCKAETVEELIKILTDGVLDGDEYIEEEERVKIFEKSMPVEVYDYSDDNFFEDPDSTMRTVDAYDFIKEIREKIKNVSDIKRITVTGEEENYVHYRQSYTYDNETGEYTGVVDGSEFEKDGASGGCIMMPDLDECEVEENDTNDW